MRKPRLQHWRWLLALLLGAAAWWCVGWFTTARPWFEATFPQVKSEVKHGMASLPYGEEIAPMATTARLWDGDGRYLYVETPLRNAKHKYQLIDLNTRQQVSTNEFNFHEPIKGDEQRRITAKASWHKANKSGTKHVTFLRESSDPPDHVSALWEWNPFTNDVRCSKGFPKAERLDISLNGAVLLEVERVTPIQPLLLLPPSLTSTLCALADAKVQSSDLVLYRLWSLPELKLLSSITTHHLEYANLSAFMTSDGSHLVFTQASLPKDYYSARSIKVPEQVSHHERIYYVHQPVRNEIYSTATGKLVWSLQDDPANWFQADPNVAPGTDAVGYSSNGRTYSLHVPTKSWIPRSVCKNSKRLDDHRYHGICYYTTESSSYPQLLTFDLDGSHQHTTTFLDSYYADVIPSAPQTLLLKHVNRQDQLPGWLTDLLWDRRWFQEWAQEQWLKMSVWDYSANRIIWSRQRYEIEHYELTDRWLMFEDQDVKANTLTVSVFALPFPSWSLWWARLVGLFVALSVWCYLRSSHRRAPSPLTSLPPGERGTSQVPCPQP